MLKSYHWTDRWPRERHGEGRHGNRPKVQQFGVKIQWRQRLHVNFSQKTFDALRKTVEKQPEDNTSDKIRE